MPKTAAPAHDDYVEVELTKGTSKIQKAMKGLDARKQKEVMQAVEVCVNEGIDQALDWANEHFEEYDTDLSTAASGVLVAMARAGDEPAVIGRVLGAFLIIGLEPEVAGALKARRAGHGAKAQAALADYLARVQKMFAGADKARPRQPTAKKGPATRQGRKAAKS